MTAGTLAMFATAILMGLCAVMLVFEWWLWRYPFNMATLALVALSPTK